MTVPMAAVLLDPFSSTDRLQGGCAMRSLGDQHDQLGRGTMKFCKDCRFAAKELDGTCQHPAISSIVWCSAARAISKPPFSANCTSSRICRMTWRGSLSGVDRSMLTAIENFVRWSAPQEITHQPGDQLGRLDQDAVTQAGQDLQL